MTYIPKKVLVEMSSYLMTKYQTICGKRVDNKDYLNLPDIEDFKHLLKII